MSADDALLAPEGILLEIATPVYVTCGASLPPTSRPPDGRMPVVTSVDWL